MMKNTGLLRLAAKTILLAAALTAAGCTTPKAVERAASAASRIGEAKAFGEHWSLDVGRGPGLDHPTKFTWGMGTPATGTLTEDGAAGEVLRLKGKLNTAEGERPATITFAPEDCVDDGDKHHAYLVRVEIAGLDIEPGCGDLTP